MKNIDFFHINDLCDLHNEDSIFFCKTDYISKDFETIQNKKHKVIFITGNSDYSITDEIIRGAPKNIVSWYCQNAISNHPIIKPIPIGMENKIEATRSGHGIGYQDRVQEKEKIISELKEINPNKLIYANFNINTNREYRIQLQSFIKDIPHIEWEEPKLSLFELFNKFLQYKMVLCPIGNGVDTHRLWEALYCGRIPITIKIGDYQLYRLYRSLPIIILDNWKQLQDEQYLLKLYQDIINKQYNLSLLDASYWIDTIKQDHAKLYQY